MNKFQVELDNRIFALQQKELPQEIADVVVQADVAYLQDRDVDAEILVGRAEEMYNIHLAKKDILLAMKIPETISAEDVEDLMRSIDEMLGE